MILTWWMILAAAALSPLRAFALCVAADGHWSVEPAHVAPACDTHWTQHHLPEGGLEPADAEAHPCVDVAAIGATACADRDATLQDAPFGGVVVLAAPAGRPPARVVDAAAPRRPPPATALLRTIVLLA